MEIATKPMEELLDNARPDVSVIICVYTDKRWDDILEAVASVRRQQLPPREILIVVDNNPSLLEACKAEFPDLTVLANNRIRGLSGARNTGISASTGELVAFLDDDAVADERWLSDLASHFDRAEVLGVTGFVYPIWKTDHPDWFPDEFLWTVGCCFNDPRAPNETSHEVRNVSGGAMMMRRPVFASVGGFSYELGRRGAGLPISCEETELCIRAKAAKPGGVFLKEPSARVGHKVTLERTTWRYFLLRCYAEGLSKALVAKLGGTGAILGTEGSYVLRTLTAGVARNLLASLSRAEAGGLKRAFAIMLGLGTTGFGYVIGHVVAETRGRPEPIRA
jgi:GT2 family glycosyltransferase